MIIARRALSCLAIGLCAATFQARAQVPPRDVMLADFTRVKATLLAYIDAAPDSMLGFRPTPGVRSFAQQVQHIVESHVDVGALALRGLPRSPVLGDSARYLHDKQQLRAYAAAAYDYVIAAMRDAAPAAYSRVSALYGQPPAPAWRWLQLTHEHAVWTFGQMVPYLRLNGVTPPAYSIPF